MNRISLIQQIFKKTDFQNYLEIGCQTGKSFLPIKAKSKTAVDPVFMVPLKNKIKWLVREPKNIRNRYFEEESDVFFSERKEYLNSLRQLDVVLVDGLHTFRAALNDVLNSLKYLNENGIIIMHDCLPPHEAAALPYLPPKEERSKIEGWTGQWCGDVWKAVVYLRKKYPDDLDVSVLNMDFGLGIVRFKNRLTASKLVIDEDLFQEIDKLTYKHLTAEPETMLNLKTPEYADVIVAEIEAVAGKKYF